MQVIHSHRYNKSFYHYLIIEQAKIIVLNKNHPIKAQEYKSLFGIKLFPMTERSQCIFFKYKKLIDN